MKSLIQKIRVLLIIALTNLLISSSVWAQSPEKMSYQAVVRNSSDVLVTNTQIGMEINIRQGSPAGTVVYTETQTPTTNANGLVSIEIGSGAGFSTIDWASDTYFIETKTAIAPPLTTYTITGVSQLLSVPYALHAKTAESLVDTIPEADPIFGASVASGIAGTDTTYWNHKLDSYTETDPSVPIGTQTGDMQYWNGSAWVPIPVGQPGQFLQLSSANIPTWAGLAYPAVASIPASTISYTSATSGGNVASDGGAAVSVRGICYSSVNTIPTISDNTTTDGAGTGIFASSLSGLTPGTTYYVRAYATNSVGTAYGNVESFSTLPLSSATLSTTAATSIALTTASSGGNITDDGGSPVTVRGICYSSVNTIPTISDNPTTDGTGTGMFTSSLSGLTPGTTYYVRAYATNSVGTAYGNVESFATLTISIATLSTTAGSSITLTTASSGGNITDDGGSPVTVHGICYSSVNTTPTISDNPTTDGTGTGIFTSSLSGLTPGTTYYVRAYATNSVGTAYGNVVNFTTVTTPYVGMPYQGGIVAYVLQVGDPGYDAGVAHGLIAAPSDQSTSTEWGCTGTVMPGADGTALGTGAQNTIDIENGCTTVGTAADICANLVLGGYSDWYLPSIDELYKLYLNEVVIGGFYQESYWSSSEVDATLVWAIWFGGGGSIENYNKSTFPLGVRAVRSF